MRISEFLEKSARYGGFFCVHTSNQKQKRQPTTKSKDKQQRKKTNKEEKENRREELKKLVNIVGRFYAHFEVLRDFFAQRLP